MTHTCFAGKSIIRQSEVEDSSLNLHVCDSWTPTVDYKGFIVALLIKHSFWDTII